MTGSTSKPTVDNYFSQGEILATEGKLREAEESFTCCIKLLMEMSALLEEDPWRKKLALVHNNRGHVRYRLVEFTKAIEDYTEALKYDNTLAPAFYNRGTIHYRLNRFQEAAHDMQQALHIDPTFHNASEALQKCTSGQAKKC